MYSQSPADVILQDACLLVRLSHVSLSASSSLYFQCLRLHFYANTHLKPRKFSITCDIVYRGHHPTMISQTLEGRYVDKEKLVKLLKALFGVGNFSIKVRGSWSLRGNFQCPILTDLFHGRTWMTASNFQCLGSLPTYVIKPNSDKSQGEYGSY